MQARVIARVCHELYRGYAEAYGDVILPWEAVPEPDQNDIVQAVTIILSNPNATASTLCNLLIQREVPFELLPHSVQVMHHGALNMIRALAA